VKRSNGMCILEIQSGFHSELDGLINCGKDISVEIAIAGPAVYNHHYRCIDDRDSVIEDRVSSHDRIRWTFNLENMQLSVAKISFIVCAENTAVLNEIDTCALYLKQDELSVLGLHLKGSHFLHNTKTVILAEIYHKNHWRIAADVKGLGHTVGDLFPEFNSVCRGLNPLIDKYTLHKEQNYGD